MSAEQLPPDALERLCRWCDAHPKVVDCGLACFIGAAFAVVLFTGLSK